MMPIIEPVLETMWNERIPIKAFLIGCFLTSFILRKYVLFSKPKSYLIQSFQPFKKLK
jgi:hypothetical protein